MSERFIPDLKACLNGESPRARGAAKRERVLAWVLRWGYSSADLIRRVAGQKKNGYALSLVKLGLFREVKTYGYIPAKVYVLTRRGLEEALNSSADYMHYPEIDPSKVYMPQMRHYLMAQDRTIGALEAGAISDYQTERMFAEGKKDEKRPDVIWLHRSSKIGIEVELSGKRERELDQMVQRLINSLRTNEDQAVFLSEAVIVTTLKEIATRYKKAIQPGQPLMIWEKNKVSGKWEAKKKTTVPDWLSKKVHILLKEGK